MPRRAEADGNLGAASAFSYDGSMRRLAGLGFVGWLAVALHARSHPQAPPFPTSAATDWIGAPASWSRLKGHVVLLDVWTFG